VDAVDITTEVSVHTPGMAAIEAGCHAVVQKPLAIRCERPRRCSMRRISAASRCRAGNARYNRGIRIAKWVGPGRPGTPQMVSVTALGTRCVARSLRREFAVAHQKLIGAGGASMDIGPTSSTTANAVRRVSL